MKDYLMNKVTFHSSSASAQHMPIRSRSVSRRAITRLFWKISGNGIPTILAVFSNVN